MIGESEIRELKSKARFEATGTGPRVDVVTVDHNGKPLRAWEAALERADNELVIVRSIAKSGMSFENASFESGDLLVDVRSFLSGR